MALYKVNFIYWPRTWFRKSAPANESHAFEALDTAQLLRIVKTWGSAHFGSRRWRMTDFVEAPQTATKQEN